jgi:hypothetical protein
MDKVNAWPFLLRFSGIRIVLASKFISVMCNQSSADARNPSPTANMNNGSKRLLSLFPQASVSFGNSVSLSKKRIVGVFSESCVTCKVGLLFIQPRVLTAYDSAPLNADT